MKVNSGNNCNIPQSYLKDSYSHAKKRLIPLGYSLRSYANPKAKVKCTKPTLSDVQNLFQSNALWKDEKKRRS